MFGSVCFLCSATKLGEAHLLSLYLGLHLHLLGLHLYFSAYKKGVGLFQRWSFVIMRDILGLVYGLCSFHCSYNCRDDFFVLFMFAHMPAHTFNLLEKMTSYISVKSFPKWETDI